jgi:hypothetical protein
VQTLHVHCYDLHVRKLYRCIAMIYVCKLYMCMAMIYMCKLYMCIAMILSTSYSSVSMYHGLRRASLQAQGFVSM